MERLTSKLKRLRRVEADSAIPSMIDPGEIQNRLASEPGNDDDIGVDRQSVTNKDSFLMNSKQLLVVRCSAFTTIVIGIVLLIVSLHESSRLPNSISNLNETGIELFLKFVKMHLLCDVLIALWLIFVSILLWSISRTYRKSSA